jgi:uncharacterized protein YcaQ
MASETLAEPTTRMHDSLEMHRLLRRIRTLTQHQVDDLAISHRAGELVITGRSRTYYVKQLATQAVLSASPRLRFANEIAVG